MERIISFQNPGIIDYRCITTQGASVKEGENPIGFFGTGLKYAIAIILRNGGKINIYRGKERLEFTLKEVSIRGKMFPLVHMNGKELGFTAELGKTWLMWQAFREVYCNTVDEGGRMHIGHLPPKDGHTTIVVDEPVFSGHAHNPGEYFLEGQPLQSTAGAAELFKHSSEFVYYRRVRVGTVSKPWKFTPNILGDMELTEDRTLKYSFTANEYVGLAVSKIEDREFLSDWLLAGKDYMEHTISVSTYGMDEGAPILQLARKFYNDPHDHEKLNVSLRDFIRSREGRPSHVKVRLMPAEEAMLNQAIELCRQMGYTVDDYTIQAADTLGEGVLGEADVKAKKIWLARAAISQGNLMLAGTLIEEWAHIKHRFSDCSRAMQNWLLQELMKQGMSYIMERDSK